MTASLPWLPVTLRIVAAVGGGYFFVWGLSALIVALTLLTSGDYDEGLTLAYLLAFVVYLIVFLWAFAAKNLTRVRVVLVGGGTMMTIVAWALTRASGAPH